MKERGAHHVRTDQVTDRSCYIQCPAKIGLVRLEGDRVCLIDSGSDKDAGRRVRQILDANGWRLTAIYNTHSNADHIGGISISRSRQGAGFSPRSGARLYAAHSPGAKSFLYGAIPSGSFGASF